MLPLFLCQRAPLPESGPVLTSPLSTPSPRGLLERNELSTEQRLAHTERPLAACYLSVWVYVDVWVKPVCASEIIMQTSDMRHVFLPSRRSSANSCVSVKQHPELPPPIFKRKSHIAHKLCILAMAYCMCATNTTLDWKHRSANMRSHTLSLHIFLF